MQKALHPFVVEEAMAFQCLGFANPPALVERGPIVVQPKYPGEKVAIVAVDTLRCSSTIVALLARGATGVTTFSKFGEAGVTDSEALRAANALGAQAALAGELHGQPLPGGIVGNSPIDASYANNVEGLLIRFSSTNFGQLLSTLLPLADRFDDAGGNVSVYVACFENAVAIADEIKKGSYSRVFLAAGGFYSVSTIEDLACCGTIIEAMDFDIANCDDEAVGMVAVSRMLHDPAARLAACERTLIGRSLVRFGRGIDIAAAVTGEGLEPDTKQRMRHLIATVQKVAGVPVIMSTSVD